MTVATKIVNTETLLFGLAELFLGDSLTNEGTVTPVFNSSDYFGCKVEVSFVIDKTFLKTYGMQSGVRILKDMLLTASELKLDTEFIELTEKNLSYVMGGSGSDTNILDNMFSQPEALRAELVFTYPNKTDTMTLIIPKVKVSTTSIPFEFSPESPMQMPLSLSALKCTNAAWSTNPLGKIIFS